MKVSVLYRSRTGNTSRAAEWIAGAVEAVGPEVSLTPVEHPDLDALAHADLVFVGTWVDGLIVVGHRPGEVGKLVRHLPPLWDKPVVAFLTHAVNPGNAAAKLADLLTDRFGANVVASRSFHRRRLPDGVEEFVDTALEAVSVQS
jgi:menaquinone-dependent protoporphyrinogen IX oxidase